MVSGYYCNMINCQNRKVAIEAFKMSAGLTWRSAFYATLLKYLNTFSPPDLELRSGVDKEKWAVSTFIHII